MKKTTRNKIGLTLGAIIIIALILPKLHLFQTEAQEAQSASGRRQQATPVEATIITPKLLRDKVETTGNIMANESVDLKSESSGKIVEIHFQEGRPVKKNDLLIKTNDAELQARLLRVHQQKKLAAEREYRQRQLLQKQAISQEEYDQTANELNNLKAEEQLIKAQIDKTEIHAPFDGVIGLRAVSIGDYITPSSKIASLQDINPVKIDFSIPEKYAQRVKVGDKIHFTVGSNDTVYEGSVYALEPRITEDTRTLQIRAIAKNEQGTLLPGSFAEVELILNEINNAVMIPSEALIPEFQGQKVYVNHSGKAIPKDVKTGIRTADKIQITNGLASGDTVITAGIQNLRPGAPIEITGYTE